MYKVPAGVTVEDLAQFIGTEGSILHPIEDNNGNLVVSIQEWEAPQFQYIKEQYPDIAAQFELINFEPKPITDTAP